MGQIGVLNWTPIGTFFASFRGVMRGKWAKPTEFVDPCSMDIVYLGEPKLLSYSGTLCAHWLDLYASLQGGAQGQNSPGTSKMAPKLINLRFLLGYLRLAA